MIRLSGTGDLKSRIAFMGRWHENPLAKAASRTNLPFSHPFPVEIMASTSPIEAATSTTSSRNIPLLCSVCPETPQFSDVSHLLTHIASKGHLHHETQTRLKSHQDLSATIALQRYEHWYKEHGIETLLVSRLKAKQHKEDARRKRARPVATAPPVKPGKKRSNRSDDTVIPQLVVKTEDDAFSDLSSLPPQIFSPDKDAEDYFTSNDAMSLKGQIWPGMGKMDLANEEMKRTRNQRKPKSVIDKMRRTSEGIEPNQVIMSSDLEIERVKDVYDDASSPIPGQEEATPPRKTAKPKRKRPEPLSEISVNIQRGASNPVSRKPNSRASKGWKRKVGNDTDQGAIFGLSNGWGTHQTARKLFHNNDGTASPFDDPLRASPTPRERKYNIRERLSMSNSNPIPHTSLGSPVLSSRTHHGHTHTVSSRLERSKGQDLAGHGILGPFDQSDNSFSFHGNAVYNNPARISQLAPGPFGSLSNEPFRLLSTGHDQVKQEEYPCSMKENPVLASAQPFMHLSGNPLLPQGQAFLGTFGQTSSSPQPLNCLGFTPINRVEGQKYPQDHQKLELFPEGMSQIDNAKCKIIERPISVEKRDPEYELVAIWGHDGTENTLGLPNDLSPERINI